MQLGLDGVGETEELALEDLLYRISSWRTGF